MALHADIRQSRLLCIREFCSDAELAAFDIAKAVRAHRRVQQRRKLISDVEDHIGDLHNWAIQGAALRPQCGRTQSRIRLSLHSVCIGKSRAAHPVGVNVDWIGKAPNVEKAA